MAEGPGHNWAPFPENQGFYTKPQVRPQYSLQMTPFDPAPTVTSTSCGAKIKGLKLQVTMDDLHEDKHWAVHRRFANYNCMINHTNIIS